VRGDGAAAEQKPRPCRKWLRRLGGLAIAAVLLCAAEIILELADYGGPTRIFIKLPEGDGTESYVTNVRAFRATFASNPAVRAQNVYPAPPPQRFPVEKSPGTYRIFVVGGSAAMGFPYPINGSFPLFLQSIAGTVCQGKRVEVVNVGVSAVNSYGVLERIGEVLGYGADMVVVYSGHNEFYGAYGAASAIPLSARRPVTLVEMWLRRRRLSMAMGDLAARLRGAPPESEVNRQLAQIMPRRTDIRYQNPLYLRVRENYKANLMAVVRAARRRGIPVVLCTLGSNMRDFSPLGSLHAPGFSPQDEAQWRARVGAGRRLNSEGKLEAAAAEFQAAAALSPGHAQTQYELARCLDRLGRYQEAKKHYEAARDADTVRWRAGGDYNDVVREVAREAADSGVLLADVAEYLARQAPDGIPGSELFLEHVHATLEGNFRIAECVARAVSSSSVGASLGKWDWASLQPFEHYVAANGLDDVDVLLALQRAALVQAGLAGAGAVPKEDGDDAYGKVLRRMALIEEGLDDAQTAALGYTEAAAHGAPPGAGSSGTGPDGAERRGHNPSLSYDMLHVFLTMEYGERGDWQRALREVDNVTHYGAWQLTNVRYAGAFVVKGNVLLKSGDPAAATKAAQKALALDPRRAEAMRLMSRACSALGDAEAARQWADRAQKQDAPQPAGKPPAGGPAF